MAYVTEKRGVFYAVIYEGRNPVSGRERRRWHRCDDRRDAEAVASSLTERRARQRHTGSSLTFADYLLGQWLPAKEATLAPTTHARYVTSVEHYLLPHLGDTPLRRLKTEHLETLYRRLLLIGGRRGGPLAAKTITNLHQIVRSSLNDAVERGLLLSNPAVPAHVPDPRKRPSGRRRARSWSPTVRIRIVEGPSSYLFGEETALLEVVDGRQPFPRVDPPFRRGIDPGHQDVGHSAANVHLAAPGGTDAAPALVNNVETTANVVGIVRHGADWYRSVGTAGSPGTLVCTVTGHTKRHGVGEVAMGTTLREAITAVGGGPRAGREILAVLSGVANPVISASLLDTPLGFDEMAGIGSGLGAGGFIVFQDGTDMLSVAHGVARFLAVESCGQCEPCKRDGLAIAAHLGSARAGQATDRDVESLHDRLNTVTRGARCALASQQEQVVGR